jgi:serine/threonine-protein kinase
MAIIEEIQMLTTNQVIANEYQIIELLGQPDKARLYKAFHMPSNTMVIVKVLTADKVLSEQSKKSFKERLKALLSLKHPHIVTPRDYGVLDNGLLYVVTDYIEGPTLADCLKEKKYLEFREALPIFRQICLALAYAHNLKIAHGAICPENIFIDKRSGTEVIKLCNFHVKQFARARANEKADSESTEIFADSTYMSPEQCRGESITGSSDIYSLGCVMYKALSGITTLFEKKGTTALYLHVYELPLPLSMLVENLPCYLEDVISKAIEKAPYDRYHSADKLLAALEFVEEMAIEKANLQDQPRLKGFLKEIQLIIKHNFRSKFIGELRPSPIPDTRNFSGVKLQFNGLQQAEIEQVKQVVNHVRARNK